LQWLFRYQNRKVFSLWRRGICLAITTPRGKAQKTLLARHRKNARDLYHATQRGRMAIGNR